MRLLGTLRGSEYLLHVWATWTIGGQRIDCGSQPPTWPPMILTFWYSHSYIVYSNTASGLFFVANRLGRSDCMSWGKVLQDIVASVLLFLLLWGASCHVLRMLKQSYGEAYMAKNWGFLQTAMWVSPSQILVKSSDECSPSQQLHGRYWARTTKLCPFSIPKTQKLWGIKYLLF